MSLHNRTGYSAEGQYGHKKADLALISRHIRPDTKTFAEPFGGTGVVAWHAKGLGIKVTTNDVMAFSHLRLKVFVENDTVALTDDDIRILTAPVRGKGRTVDEWYGEALGRKNAAFLDTLAANLSRLGCEMKRNVAVCLAVLCVMRHMVFSSVKFGVDDGFSGRRTIKEANLRTEFRRFALHEFPRLLRAGKGSCRASRRDAIAFTAGTTCDVLYADPPFPSPGGCYQSDLAFYDKLVHVLQGHPELVERPHHGPPALPPHSDFTKRNSALMAIKRLFRAAQGARRVILSFNTTSAVRPHEIIMAARDWYGGLSACEWMPSRLPTSGKGRRRTTANVLMVFDKGKSTSAPRWNPKDVTFADLFCGLGGFRAALQSANGRCVFSSEIDKNAVAAYRANWGDIPSGDIRAIPPEDIPEHLVLCAGFPCPSFSGSGKGGGYKDDRGLLFFEIPRIAAIRRPCVLILENVPAFASPDKPWLALAKEALEGVGYRVFYEVLDAGHYGCRTARKRVYLVCFRKDLRVEKFQFPRPTFEPVRLADVLLPDSETEACVVRHNDIRIDECAVARAGSMSSLKPLIVGQIGDRKIPCQGNRIYGSQGLSVTLMANGGGMGAKTGLYWINGRVRKLHPTECKRVMGFPDSFIVPASISPDRTRRLFGNSVVVPVVRRIFDRVVETLSPLGGGSALAA